MSTRTTVTLEDDVAAAIELIRAERGCGVSEIVNDLVRKGLLWKPPEKPFVMKSYPMGLKIDVTNVAEAIEELEGPDWR